MSRIVITGAGVVSAIGAEDFWENLTAGARGVRPVSRFRSQCNLAAEVADFDARSCIASKGVMSRSASFISAAARLALANANLDLSYIESSQVGIFLGTAFGSNASMSSFDEECLRDGDRFVDPMAFPNTVTNSPAGHLSILLRTTGINITLSTGLASGLDAVEQAASALRRRELKVALAGGYDELCRETHDSLARAGVLSTDDLSAPLDCDRSGFFLGEGAAILALERLDDAVSRNAPILAELAGFGTAFCLDQSEAAGVEAKAMNEAIISAQLDSSDISYISSSARGSIAGDRAESEAIENVFKSRAAAMPIAAIRSMTGECGGAAGAMQLIAAALSTRFNLVPPTIGFKAADADSNLRGISDRKQFIACRAALVNSFNGIDANSSFIVRRIDEL
jgi:3-oxoacyl-[acyl-carrier-protein] synthase II